MYFLIEPKSKKEDFFNYEYEYKQLHKALKNERIIALIGPRRVGKTSLMNVVYNEIEGLKLWIDGRIITDPKKELFSALYEVIKEKKPKIFGKIESLNVSLFGVGITLDIKGKNLREIKKDIKKAGKIYIFIDEIQYINKKEISEVLSYFYDLFPEVTFIVSGSEVGLINEILGESEKIGHHPLLGRHILKITLNRLDKSKSLEFLQKGFSQLNIKIDENEIEEAIDKLDGLIGWLTLFGYERAILKNKDALKKTIDIAVRISASELSNFLKKIKNEILYITILRKVDGTTWTELKNLTEKALKKEIDQSMFNYALSKLVKYSFIEKRGNKYFLSDPLIAKATYLI